MITNSLLNILIQILKPVIDYTSLVIDYQRGFSENNFQESHLFKWFMNGHQRWLGSTNLKRVFHCPKWFYPLKRLREFFWTEMSYPLKTFLGQNTCNSIRNYLSVSLFNLSLSREISSSLLLTSEKGLRDRGSLVVEDSWTQGKGCPCVVQTL